MSDIWSYEEMLQRGIEPNVVSFGAVINACAKASNLQRAEYWHHTMLEMGVKLGAGSFFFNFDVFRVFSICLSVLLGQKSSENMLGIYGISYRCL